MAPEGRHDHDPEQLHRNAGLPQASRHHTAISGVGEGWVETDLGDGCGRVMAREER